MEVHIVSKLFNIEVLINSQIKNSRRSLNHLNLGQKELDKPREVVGSNGLKNGYANDDCACALLYILFSDSPRVVMANLPFLSSFLGTTISPWIVTLDALEPFACDAPKQVSGICIDFVCS